LASDCKSFESAAASFISLAAYEPAVQSRPAHPRAPDVHLDSGCCEVPATGLERSGKGDVERDGAHTIVDLLREPLHRRLQGLGVFDDACGRRRSVLMALDEDREAAREDLGGIGRISGCFGYGVAEVGEVSGDEEEAVKVGVGPAFRAAEG
jgi:hypothetical protein